MSGIKRKGMVNKGKTGTKLKKLRAGASADVETEDIAETETQLQLIDSTEETQETEEETEIVSLTESMDNTSIKYSRQFPEALDSPFAELDKVYLSALENNKSFTDLG